MSPNKAHIMSVLFAFSVLAGCRQSSVDTSDDERMAQAMRKVEADQAKSDKLQMARAAAEARNADQTKAPNASH